MKNRLSIIKKYLFLIILIGSFISNLSAFSYDKKDYKSVNIVEVDCLKENSIQVTNEQKQSTKIKLDGEESLNLKEEETTATKWYQDYYITGYWNGIRKRLEDHGITLGVTYFSEPFFKVSGGLTNHSKMKYLGLVDFSFAICITVGAILTRLLSFII